MGSFLSGPGTDRSQHEDRGAHEQLLSRTIRLLIARDLTSEIRPGKLQHETAHHLVPTRAFGRNVDFAGGSFSHVSPPTFEGTAGFTRTQTARSEERRVGKECRQGREGSCDKQ